MVLSNLFSSIPASQFNNCFSLPFCFPVKFSPPGVILTIAFRRSSGSSALKRSSFLTKPSTKELAADWPICNWVAISPIVAVLRRLSTTSSRICAKLSLFSSHFLLNTSSMISTKLITNNWACFSFSSFSIANLAYPATAIMGILFKISRRETTAPSIISIQSIYLLPLLQSRQRKSGGERISLLEELRYDLGKFLDYDYSGRIERVLMVIDRKKAE